jgi:hypothetical protein
MNYCKIHGHRFPDQSNWGSLGSRGRIEVTQCNNCLTVKVIQKNDVKVNDEWIVIKKETIVDDGTIERD